MRSCVPLKTLGASFGNTYPAIDSQARWNETSRGFEVGLKAGKMSQLNMLHPTPELPDDTPISDVEFPSRIRNVLAAAGLKTVGEAGGTSAEILLSFQVLG